MRLLIADDHVLFRDSLASYIEQKKPDCTLLLADNLYDVFDIMHGGAQLDLIMLDLNMPGMNGLEGFEKLKTLYPGQRITIISGLAEPNEIHHAMAMGVAGFFPKTLSAKGLMSAIELVISGERYLPIDQRTSDIMPTYYYHSRGEQRPVIPNMHGDTGHSENKHKQPGNKVPDTLKNLTKRENDVLNQLLKGLSNKEIGRALDIEEVTVKLHVRGICKKLNASNRTQAAMIARESMNQ